MPIINEWLLLFESSNFQQSSQTAQKFFLYRFLQAFQWEIHGMTAAATNVIPFLICFSKHSLESVFYWESSFWVGEKLPTPENENGWSHIGVEFLWTVWRKLFGQSFSCGLWILAKFHWLVVKNVWRFSNSESKILNNLSAKSQHSNERKKLVSQANEHNWSVFLGTTF